VDRMSTRKSASEGPRQLTCRDMLAPLFRKRWMVVATFCSIFALSILLAWGWASGYYVSTMQVLVGRERSEPTVTSQQNGTEGNNKVVTTDEVASEVALLQGRDMLREVVQTCKLAEENISSWNIFETRYPDARRAAALDRATTGLAKKLKVEAEKTSHMIDLRYGRSGPPETAACVLQTLGKLYLEKHLRLQRPAGASDFFAQETDKYRQALTDSETQLANFSKTEGIAAPETLRTDMASQLVMAQSSLYRARQEIAADKRRIENVKAQMEVTPARSSTTEASIAASILLQQLQSTLLTAVNKRTQLLMKYDPSYPLVKEAEEEIAQTKESIAKAEEAQYVNKTTDRDQTFEYLRQDDAKTQADLASEQATASALSNTIRGMQSQMVNLDVKAVEQAGLLREAKANESNYLLYLNKREQERTSDALDEKRVANVAIAVPAFVPVLPAYSPFLIMYVGLFLGTLGGIGAGYLAELTDRSFRTPDEVADMLKITVLAAVPKRVA
jgi:polysaccharide biosynthesis transport protein